MYNKTATKGMRDLLPSDVKEREAILSIIKKTYESFGFLQIETPCVEDIKLLTGKQGGDNEKLIFKILKRGEKLENASDEALCDLGLRFDLTVPLVRFFKNNCGNLPSVFKSIQIGNVWRAERPQKDRFRQFVQCDIDVIGEESILAEIELILATTKALSNLGLSGFAVRLNDRRILKALATKSQFDEEDFDKVFVALDKLDKIGEDGVKQELVAQGFECEKVNNFVELVQKVSSAENVFDSCQSLLGDIMEKDVVENLKTIFGTIENLNANFRLILDPTLVRGMNYYTGAIFEIALDGIGVSVAGGGRYDKMMDKFFQTPTPACGFSIGFERICNLLKSQGKVFEVKKEKVAIVIQNKMNVASLAKVFEQSEEFKKNSICTVVKKINNFSFLLKQLKSEGMDKIYLSDDVGELKLIEEM